ncbi:hypothetical protein, partial [Streptomyces minutiscleroticus]|uniref:hypothetical protein n=1 Tax=Streptomyces minutiscleroticus TaxID=68238 RepID=UPI003319C821
GRGGRGGRDDEVTVDDVMAGSSLANRRTMPGTKRLVAFPRFEDVRPRRQKTYLLCRVHHTLFGYKSDISPSIRHELPSFAADFRRSR